MDKIETIEITDSLTGEITKHVIIDRGNGEYTSMLKSTYDEQLKAAKAAKLNEPVTQSE
jgi:hypothetical protein